MFDERSISVLLGGVRVFGREIDNALEFADRIHAGFPRAALDAIKHLIQLNDSEASELIGVNARTLARWRGDPEKPLSPLASDRLYRLARVFALAEEVLEDEDSARDWLRTPQFGLDNRVPMELLTSEAGTREVENLLKRIEHAVYS
ncbi:MAG: type II toxin-antitoxin system Xre/ParS family antitoxin [Pseudomonadota bacterium]